MAREHLDVLIHVLGGHLHCSDHVLCVSFKEATTPSNEDSVSCKHCLVHVADDVVAINHLIGLLAALLGRVDFKEDVAPSMAGSVVALDHHVHTLQAKLSSIHYGGGAARDVIVLTSYNPKLSLQQIHHLLVAASVV